MTTLTQNAGAFARQGLGWRELLASDTALVAGLALLPVLAHLLTGTNYGFFRDELYYIDAGQHLAAGYVEFPSFIALLAAGIHALCGDALLAYHVLPALAGACLILLSGLMARAMGGGRLAQALTAVACVVAPLFLSMDSLFTVDAFDELWWVLAVYALVLLIKRDRPRLWLLFGLAIGLGLLTKLTIVTLCLALLIGLLLTPERRYLTSRWVFFASLLALFFLVPYVIWNAINGWPTLVFWRTYSAGHSDPSAALGFVWQQILSMNPLALPLWLLGLGAFFWYRPLQAYRALGLAYIILFALFLIMHAKFYFLAPAYPMLFAAGALVCERFWQMHPRWQWIRPTYISLLFLLGIVLAPIAMPILPPASYGQIMAFAGGNAGVQVEKQATGVLPQQLADRFGWDTMTATVAGVYDSLPASERAQACILTANYGEAGAIDLYGPAYHLPQAISAHNTYYLWGPRNCSGAILILLGYPLSQMQPYFTSMSHAATITCSYCMPYEDNVPVYLARGLRGSMQAFWQHIKHFD
jgi:4-amino-4-deoxy-L-arabinose transferase-like glycosyltransferase